MEEELASILADAFLAEMKQNPEKYASRASGKDAQGVLHSPQ
jgi:hypothetical protein